MTERAKQTAADAVFVWEIGMLRFLFCKGLLNEAEYKGILEIAEREKPQKFMS